MKITTLRSLVVRGEKRLATLLVAGSLAVVMALTGPILYAQHIVRTVTHQAREVVVKLGSHNPDITSSCSAVIVEPEFAYTAAHCVTIPELELQFDNGRKYLVTTIYINQEGKDLALLKVSGLPCPCASMLPEDQIPEGQIPALRDEQAFAIGYPYGAANVLTSGLIQGRVTNPDTKEQFLLSTTLVGPGNSGGGLFIVRDGIAYLVGITIGYLGSPYLTLSVELALE